MKAPACKIIQKYTFAWKLSKPRHLFHQAFYLESLFQVVEQDFWLGVFSDRNDFRYAPCEIYCCLYGETPLKGEVRAIHLCIGLQYDRLIKLGVLFNQ